MPRGRETGRGPRRDALRNRSKLLDSAGDVLRAEPRTVAMPVIAERAGLSVATAYRYFPSLDDLLNAYLHDVTVQLRDYSHGSLKTGTALFEDVVAQWTRLLRVYGPALVQIRSRTGFLTRLSEVDDILTPARDAWERPIRGVMRHLGIPEEHFAHALFLCNMMFDPREVLDLINTGLAEETALSRLTMAYYGALQGWANSMQR